MDTNAEQNPLEIEVSDYGPIINAKIDMRPLTVFIGPSNTGKSYLAILIYALQRVFYSETSPLGRRFYRPYPHRMMDAHALSDSDVKRLFEFARSLDDAPQNIVLPPAIVKILRSKMKTLGERLNHEILRCFGLSGTNALIREGSGSPLRVMIRNRNSEQVQEYAFTFGERTELNAMMPDDPGLQINIDHEKSAGYFRRLHEEFLAGSSDGSFGSPASELLSFLAKSALHSLFGSLSVPAYYLPADRTGVMHAHSVVVSALIASAPTAGLRPSARTPILSGVLADFLEELIEIP